MGQRGARTNGRGARARPGVEGGVLSVSPNSEGIHRALRGKAGKGG